MVKNYVYLNPGLSIVFNGEKFYSENGLSDLIKDNNNAEDFLYPIVHLKGNDIEVAITHSKTQYNEEYYSFVNGQHTTQGGTHQNACSSMLRCLWFTSNLWGRTQISAQRWWHTIER